MHSFKTESLVSYYIGMNTKILNSSEKVNQFSSGNIMEFHW